MSPSPMAQEEIQIRTSRRLGVLALAFGIVIGALALFVEWFRSPLMIFVIAALLLSSALVVFDRRVKLSLSKEGIRYAEWGSSLVPWLEFAGYRWSQWRGQPYLELLPRRPSELVRSFSAYGRFNHFSHRLARMPLFSIATTRLDVATADLDEYVARFLPNQPPGAASGGPTPH